MLYEMYEDKTLVHLILEYLKCGRFFQQIKSEGQYEESDANNIIENAASSHQILSDV